MRSRTLAFSCLLIGGALALIGSGQPWWRASGEGVVLRFSGPQATGGLSQALAIVALWEEDDHAKDHHGGAARRHAAAGPESARNSLRPVTRKPHKNPG